MGGEIGSDELFVLSTGLLVEVKPSAHRPRQRE